MWVVGRVGRQGCGSCLGARTRRSSGGYGSWTACRFIAASLVAGHIRCCGLLDCWFSPVNPPYPAVSEVELPAYCLRSDQMWGRPLIRFSWARSAVICTFSRTPAVSSWVIQRGLPDHDLASPVFFFVCGFIFRSSCRMASVLDGRRVSVWAFRVGGAGSRRHSPALDIGVANVAPVRGGFVSAGAGHGCCRCRGGGDHCSVRRRMRPTKDGLFLDRSLLGHRTGSDRQGRYPGPVILSDRLFRPSGTGLFRPSKFSAMGWRYSGLGLQGRDRRYRLSEAAFCVVLMISSAHLSKSLSGRPGRQAIWR